MKQFLHEHLYPSPGWNRHGLMVATMALLMMFAWSYKSQAQCPFGGAFWGDNITPVIVGQTVTLNNYVYGDEQYQLNATSGCTYTITTCGTTSFDTQITVFGPGNVVVGYNDDFPGCGLSSSVTFTAASTGPHIVQVNEWPCDWSFVAAQIFSVTLVNCGPVSGCTNPSACNYDPSAVTDDGSCCNTQCINLSAGGGTWDGEISWELYDGGTLISSGPANSPGGVNICLADGCYTVVMIDSFGDGWNGAVLSITDNGTPIVQTTLATGYSGVAEFALGNVNSGCTNPSSPNYDPTAVCDDGSCLDPNACFDSNPSGCPEIDLGPDIVMPSCFTPCATVPLTADVFETGQSTSYEVCQIDYSPPYPFTAGTGFSIGVDDLWTGVIGLPFNFCFFGQTYNQCVVGANGLLSFNVAYAGAFCPWAFTATVPDPTLPLNSIFGPYHDIDPSICGDARFAIQGSYPCRVFIVNYDNICQFSCNNLISTHQIVLYETTNVIEVYIENKPTCIGWNTGNAVIGVQNATGTQGHVATGRQTGPWSATNEAWRFTPNGAPNFVVNWYDDNGVYAGTGMTMDVCPGSTAQTYNAEAIYTMCDGSTITVDDDVMITCQSILLPVEWLKFEAELSTDLRKVDCNWQLGSETDNDFFTVERSADTQNWTELGIVDGAGNSTSPTSYKYFDFNPLPGKSYYRIRQTDFNGAHQYSETRSVERTDGIEWVIYPNPGQGKFQVSSIIRDYKVRVLDARGREVKYSRHNQSEFELLEVNSGYYTVEFLSAENQVLKRLPLLVD